MGQRQTTNNAYQPPQAGTPPAKPQQVQPPAPIPDHRWQEVYSELKRIREENVRLRDHVDRLNYQSRPQTPPQKVDSKFDPSVQEAMQQEFDRYLKPKAEAIQQQMGMVIDRNDELEFLVKYGHENYEKYKEKIEPLRDQRSRMGQYMTREDAFKFVKFEETGRKPAENPLPPQPQVQFDKYGDPVQPNQQTVQNLQQTVETMEHPQQMQVVQPMVNPAQMQTQVPDLPPQGIIEGGAPPRNVGEPNVSMDSSEKDLEAWESRYANKPL